MSAPGFTVDVFQNEYLPDRAREVNAIVTVTSAGSAADWPAAAASAAEIIIVDCSGSMAGPMEKMIQARGATAAAIDAIRDEVAFGVVAGTNRARPVYPKDGTLTIADERTRQAAKGSLDSLHPGGGTAIGRWLRYACELFQKREDTLRHAILLTDGQNGQLPGRLAAAIERCAGVFSCDCRGVGTDWKVDELRKISTALLGTVDIVPDPAGLAPTEAREGPMAKEVADIALRVWTPACDGPVVSRSRPRRGPTARRTQAAPQAGDTDRRMGDREPRLHVCVDSAGSGRQEMLAARTADPARHQAADPGPRACPGDLDRRRGDVHPINRHVAHYTGQAELARGSRTGSRGGARGGGGRKAGDDDTAAARLGRAVALAHESGNEDTANLLAKVVDVIDPATGTVRLRAKVVDADEMALDTRSGKTVRVRK